jgi:hypothetical protein
MNRGHIAEHNSRLHDVLEFPSCHPQFKAPALPYTCKPGVFTAQMYPAREETAGGIYLPSRGGGWESEGAAAERVRPDCVTVLQQPLHAPDGWHPEKRTSEGELLFSSAQRLHSIKTLANSLRAGDRVMMRPESGVRWEKLYGLPGLCFFGQTDPWEEDAVMRWVPDNQGTEYANYDDGAIERGNWRPLTNWVMVRLDQTTVGGMVISSRPILDVIGTVLDCGPLASVRPGQRVIVADDMAYQSDDDAKWLTTKWGKWDETVWLVREVDCHGVRRIVGRLED